MLMVMVDFNTNIDTTKEQYNNGSDFICKSFSWCQADLRTGLLIIDPSECCEDRINPNSETNDVFHRLKFEI